VSRQSRSTLKDYFSDGSMPTQQHFVDLIDSTLNLKEEGFDKTVEDGEVVQALNDQDANLISFFRSRIPQQAQWRLALSGQGNTLRFESPVRPEKPAREGGGGSTAGGPDDPLLSLTQARRVGIGTAEPTEALDVRGRVAMTGRRGSLRPPGPVLADGQWHDLTGNLTGCQGFEVVAGAGGREGSGHFALLHGIALSAWNSPSSWWDWLRRRQRGIRCTDTWWGRRCDRLHLRWTGGRGAGAQYRLQIRTGCNFGPDARVQVELTQLWFDNSLRGPREPTT
jgi:hypothetical protein